jgi:hypothetical protein
MFNFIKRLFGKSDDVDTPNDVIDLLDYHYKVDNVYGEVVFVLVDIDTCDVERGSIIKLLNQLYTVEMIEYLPNNTNFNYKFVLIEYEPTK